MSKTISIRFSVFIWLALVFILVISNRNLFTVPMYEEGDLAANALQIIDAKSFSEIYGHYSRWQFNHPGPFLFYCYALGEILFYDWLHIFPSAYNAHLLASVFIQAGFFICVLYITANYCRSYLFLPLSILLACLHFGLVHQSMPGSLFINIWPAYVLLFPFLCFLVACASLATGQSNHLPIVVLCGSVLVHGHVAQPFFVMSLFLMSYVLFLTVPNGIIFQRKTGIPASILRSHVIAVLIVVVFALPLLLDLIKWPESNFNNILNYLSNSNDTKTWQQAILYVASFFGYCKTQELLFDKITPQSFTFFAQNWYYYLGWIIIFSYIGFFIWRLKDDSDVKFVRFERRFLLITFSAVILSIYWAHQQNGSMYNFNGYYIFCLPFCFLLIFSGIVSSQLYVIPNRTWHIALSFGLLSLFLSFNKIAKIPAVDNSYLMRQVAVALKSDSTGYSPKLLSFQHENWPDATTLALALRRQGIPFYVESSWGFMFGQENVWDKDVVPPGSIWEIHPKNSTHQGFSFTSNTSLVTTPFQTSLTFPLSLVFSKPLPPNIIIDGFSGIESWGRWTEGEQADIDFLVTLPKNLLLTIEASAFGPNVNQPIPITIGTVTKEIILTEQPKEYTLEFSNLAEAKQIIFKIPQPTSPKELKINQNARQLGIRLVKIIISEQ